MTYRPSRRLLLALAWPCLAATAGMLAGKVVFERARAELRGRATSELGADASALQSALDKFETLPYAMSLQPEVARALRQPGDTARVKSLDHYLADVQRHARIAVAYVVRPDGLTIAASNAGEPYTFVGNNYRFRPYMQDAMAGRIGRFYGIGATTAEPGYFLAQPVFDDGVPTRAAIGAVVLKIDLQEYERSWSSNDEPVAVIEAAGIVFLSNRADWKYRSLGPVSIAARAAIERTHQYAGHDVGRVLAPEGRWADAERVTTPVGSLGWRLMRFVDVAPARRMAASAAVAAALALIVAGLLAFVADQRRRHARVAAGARRALIEASTGLEARIATRTADLVRANTDLETRIDELGRTQALLRDTQAELIQAGKLGMLGQLAAGVTHELNQPLAALRMFADNANAFIERGDVAAAQVNLGHIAEAATRMGHIVGLLKTFSRKTFGTLAPVDLASAVGNAARLLRRDYELVGARLEVRLGHSPVVVGDAIRVEQVLINLMRNALDAVAACATRLVRVTLETGVGLAVVRIADSGQGIPDDVRPHLFEPFFTTKPPGAGLGLGLAISFSIVQAMEGELTATNTDGGGAEFVLKLPLLRTEAAA